MKYAPPLLSATMSLMHAADAVDRLAVVRVGEDLALRRELLDSLVQTALDEERAVALRAHRQRAAGVRVA